MPSERFMRWESPQRYYAARVHRDLFGQLLLSTAWGGRYSHLGDTETVPLADDRDVDAAIAAIHARRRAHHYDLVLDVIR